MKFNLVTPTQPHRYFAWRPVTVLDRKTGRIYKAWLETVNRKLVSVQGALVWTYEPVDA